MMQTVRLDRSGILTSRLAFGTSRLHRMSQNSREELLRAAVDFDIRYFDLAPSYGDGLAEFEFGRVLGRKRGDLVVATKYGIPVDPLMGSMFRWSRAAFATRAVVRRLGYRHASRPLLSGVGLAESVDASLRRLRCDWIDIVLLHEPSVDRVADGDSLREAARRLRENGKVRWFGVSGRWSDLLPVVELLPEFGEVVQTAEAEWRVTFLPDLTYSALAAGAQGAFSGTVTDRNAVERLRNSLCRRPRGAVIASTRRVDHLHELAEAAAAAKPCSLI